MRRAGKAGPQKSRPDRRPCQAAQRTDSVAAAKYGGLQTNTPSPTERRGSETTKSLLDVVLAETIKVFPQHRCLGFRVQALQVGVSGLPHLSRRNVIFGVQVDYEARRLSTVRRNLMRKRCAMGEPAPDFRREPFPKP